MVSTRRASKTLAAELAASEIADVSEKAVVAAFEMVGRLGGQCFFVGQRPLVPLLLGPPFFSDYSFQFHHPANRDDWHLLAHAMASDFSVAWRCLSKRTIVFLLRIKLHAHSGVNVMIIKIARNG
jgi:hypothetical protein